MRSDDEHTTAAVDEILEAELVDDVALTSTSAATSAIASLEDAQERARQLVEDTTPANTIRARAGAVKYFWAWADAALGLETRYPVAGDVALRFIVDHLDGLTDEVYGALVAKAVKRKDSPRASSLATIEARLAHLAKAHRVQGMEPPTTDPRVRETLRAARRARAASGGQRQAAAITLDVLERMLAVCETGTLRGVRDRALIFVAWSSGGRRRSEVAGLMVEDLRPDGEDYVWQLRRSKTDQEGQGLPVPIAGRAAEALKAWLARSRIDEGPVFRQINRWGQLVTRYGEDGAVRPMSGDGVGRVVKAIAARAGVEGSSAHGLRAGWMTTAGRAGVPLAEAMGQSGHKTAAVALRYHRVGDVLRGVGARLAG